MKNSFPSKNKFKYMRKFKTFCQEYGNTTNWNSTNTPLKIGESVKIGHTHPDHAGKIGKIGASIKKNNPDMIKVTFLDGKSDYIDKNDLIRNISIDD